MFEKLFWAAVGGTLMYFYLKDPAHRAQADAEVDLIRNKVHDLIKKYAPSADDMEVGQDVMANFPTKTAAPTVVQ
jgi:hypothetical protein